MMEKLKGVLITLLAAFVVFAGVGTTNVRAEGKVKVYLFVAGGCPYCEMEKEYLQGLSSYGEKFEIVEKELYIDHVDWEPGADYELGKKVAEAFKKAGFENAKYTSTPFVVISDLYAAATYSTSLESVINEAYEEGDKDVVSCIANDGEECLPGMKKDNSETITTLVLLLVIGGVIALVVYRGKSKPEQENNYYEEEEEKPVVKKEEKVVETTKKAPVKKKQNTKKTTKKTTSKKK